MSTTYFSWTYPVDPASIESGAQAVLDALQGATAQDDLVRDESRGDWYLGAAEKMARNIAPVALRFLDRTYDSRVVDPTGQPWAVSTLMARALPAAVAALDEVFDRTRTAPATMLPYFGGDGSTEDDIRQAISCPNEVDGDEGLGPGYLFDHLEQLRNLLKRASDAGLAIAHVRYLYE